MGELVVPILEQNRVFFSEAETQMLNLESEYQIKIKELKGVYEVKERHEEALKH